MELEQTLRALFSGGYNEYHDWQANYSTSEQAEILDKILSDFARYPSAQKSLILQSLKDFIQNNNTIFYAAAQLAVKYYAHPEIREAILPHLQLGYFSADLLEILVQNPQPCPEWIDEIEAILQKKSFTADRQTTNMKKLYKRIHSSLTAYKNSLKS